MLRRTNDVKASKLSLPQIQKKGQIKKESNKAVQVNLPEINKQIITECVRYDHVTSTPSTDVTKKSKKAVNLVALSPPRQEQESLR